MAQAQFAITVDATAYVNSLGSIAKPKLDQIVALALVDTAKSAKAKAAGVIAKRTGLKAAMVKERIYYERVDPGEYEVHIRSSKRPIALIEFPVMQTATGVSTRAWGKTQLIKHAFIATMRNGHTGVYRRVGRPRLPIEQLWGPTIGGTFARPEVQEVIAKTMKDRLSKSLARRMAAAIRRKN
jgi:hypothetical protein